MGDFEKSLLWVFFLKSPASMGSPPPGGTSSPPHSPVQSLQQDSKAWVSKVQGSPMSIANYQPDFEVVDGIAKVLIPEELIDTSVPLWKSFVVGYFMGEAPHVGSIHATVNRIWTVREKTSNIDVQFINKTTVLFRIENPSTRAHVLQRRYWHIANVPLVINEWNPSTASAPPDQSLMLLWVDLKDVPAHLYSRQGLSFLSSTVGKFVKLHPNTERCIRLDMARILVEVNMNNILTNQICFAGTNSAHVTVSVTYPWLPPRCNICSKWGHLAKACSQTVSLLATDKAHGKHGNMNSQEAGAADTRLAQAIAQELLQDLERTQSFNQGPVQNEGINNNITIETEALQLKAMDIGGPEIIEEEPWTTVTRKSPPSSPSHFTDETVETVSQNANGFGVLGKIREDGELEETQEAQGLAFPHENIHCEEGEVVETDT